MILIGLGANLPGRAGEPPRATCEAALAALADRGVVVSRRSRWYESAPVPSSDQPWYVNGVARLEFGAEDALDPAALLTLLHAVEADFGRVRGVRNAARILDLDLLAYDDLVRAGADAPTLPHPGLHERAFVLLPLAEVAPGWRHPVSGLTVEALIDRLPDPQAARQLD